MRLLTKLGCFFCLLIGLLSIHAHGSDNAPSLAGFQLHAVDEPNDGGGVIRLSWDMPTVTEQFVVKQFDIYRTSKTSQFVRVGRVTGAECVFLDKTDKNHQVENNVFYRYKIKAIFQNNDSIASAETDWVMAKAAWFDTSRLLGLGVLVVFMALFFLLVRRGKQGATLYIRPIDALDMVDDAVGRAAEMGRPVMYVPGLQTITQPATVASVSILEKVAERSARLHTQLKVPNYDPLTWPVAKEVVRQSFVRVGKSDAFRPDDVSYLTSRSFTYAAAVVGQMTREKTAANFLIGHFYSESLILAETGAATGAVQIGGTESVAQLPFFITTCDKTMIGEELFAAAALAGDDPVSRSTVKAQDWLKVIMVVFIIVGTLVVTGQELGWLEGLLVWLGCGESSEVASKIVRFFTTGDF